MSDTVWRPEFVVDIQEVLGHEWPIVFVTKWETNLIGERRRIDVRAMDFDGPLKDETPSPAERTAWLRHIGE